MPIVMKGMHLVLIYAAFAALSATAWTKTMLATDGLRQYDGLKAELVAKENYLKRLALKSGDAKGRERYRSGLKATSNWLRQVIVRYGYPTDLMVGSSGSGAAHRIVARSGDPGFQNQAVRAMKGAVTALRALPIEHAYLVDLIRDSRGQMQTYGTLLNRPKPSLAVIAENRQRLGIGVKSRLAAKVPGREVIGLPRPLVVE